MEKSVTWFRWLRAVIVLPFNALVTLPAAVLWFSGKKIILADGWRLVAGCVMIALGLVLAVWTMTLFHRVGKGTPAPWDPPAKLVVAGPYRHVRNPMLTSVFIMQVAEVLLTGSYALFVYFIVFVYVNTLYFPLVEEKQLLRRFGVEYAEYKANVPRYIPRLRPWKKRGPRYSARHRL